MFRLDWRVAQPLPRQPDGMFAACNVLFAKFAPTVIIQLRPPLSTAFSRTSRRFLGIGMAAHSIGN
jgi:hypothetical protein